MKVEESGKTEEEASDEVAKYGVNLRRFPFPSYIDDFFVIALQSQLPLFLVLSYIYPVINIAKSIVHEKERRLKESMKMMGLPNWLHWSAWFTKSFVFLLISTIFITIFFKVRHLISFLQTSCTHHCKLRVTLKYFLCRVFRLNFMEMAYQSLLTQIGSCCLFSSWYMCLL